MSSSKPPRNSLNTETWEKLRSLKEQVPSALPASLSATAFKESKPVKRYEAPQLKEEVDSEANLKKTWQDRRKEHESIIAWLCKTFPDAFNSKHPKPLKLNITHDIYAHLPTDGTISKLKLRAALKYYTHSTFYLKALVETNHRVDLQGSITEPIDPAHKEFSQELLNQRAEKMKTFKPKKPYKNLANRTTPHK